MKDLYDKEEKARITLAIEEMKAEAGDTFSLEKLNLSELERRCGVSRMRLRRLKDNCSSSSLTAIPGSRPLGETLQDILEFLIRYSKAALQIR